MRCGVPSGASSVGQGQNRVIGRFFAGDGRRDRGVRGDRRRPLPARLVVKERTPWTRRAALRTAAHRRREAPVRRAVRLGAGDEHLPQDRAAVRLARRRRAARAQLPDVKKYEHLKPLVIRIDDVGRAQAVQYDTLTYQPQGQAPELKYFLTQFVTKHFARMRATVKERTPSRCTSWTRPWRTPRSPRISATRRSRRSSPARADEVEIQVKNVTLDELKAAPYKATVDFEKVYYGARQSAGAQARDVRRADHVRAPRPDSECDGAGQSARADHHLLPRRPGLPMIANSAFLAAMVVLLLAVLAAGPAGVPGAVQARSSWPATSG